MFQFISIINLFGTQIFTPTGPVETPSSILSIIFMRPSHESFISNCLFLKIKKIV